MNRQITESRFRLDPELRFARRELIELTALWEKLRAGRPVPDRSDFTVFTLRPYFTRTLIYDVLRMETAYRFRIRIYGTLISQYSGRDVTGKFVDEVMNEVAYTDFYRGLSWSTDEWRPLRAAGTYYFVDRSYLQFESVTLPLTVGGTTIDQLLNVTYYADEP